MIKVSGKVTVDPHKQLEKLKTALQKQILKKAIREGAKPVQAAAKAAAPKDTGALRTSIGSKIKAYRRSVVGVVGSRSKYQKVKKGKTRVPVRYAHILEKRRPWLAPVMGSLRQQYFSIVRQVIEREVALVLKKGANG